MTIDDILTGPQKVKYGRYDLQLPTLGRSIEAQDQNSKDARCIAMTMARTQVVFQESLHMRLSCKPHPLCRWPELLQRLWTVTVNGVWTRDRCSVFYNTWYLGASGVSYVKRRAKITSTNEGDRCQSECATITFWSWSVSATQVNSRRIYPIGLRTGMICTTFLGPDSHETLSDEILASTNVATFGSWVHGLPSCCMNTNAHREWD